MNWNVAGRIFVFCGVIGIVGGLTVGTIIDLSANDQKGQWAMDCFNSGSGRSESCQASFKHDENVKKWTDRGWTIVGVSVLLMIGGIALLAAARTPESSSDSRAHDDRNV